MTAVASSVAENYFEPKVNSWVAPVLPGSYLVTENPDIAVTTLLGSCVAACVRDTATGIGGLNHFLLPDDDHSRSGDFSARYGVHAMEVLINEILKRGGNRRTLEAKAFGGSNVIETGGGSGIGIRNAEFVQRYLQTEGIKLTATDLGGPRARRIYFFPNTGRVTVQRLPASESRTATKSEVELKTVVQKACPTGKVELF